MSSLQSNLTVAQGNIGVLKTDVDAAEAAIGELDTRVDALEATKQPLLSNGPLPPGLAAQIPTLFAPETNVVDRVQMNYGLVLARSPDGYWMLSARKSSQPLLSAPCRWS